MIITSGLKRICDVCFFLTFGAIFTSLFSNGNEPFLIMTLPIFAGSAFLAGFLSKWGFVKYLAVFPLLSVFLLVPLTLINNIVLSTAIGILVINLSKSEAENVRPNYQRIFFAFVWLSTIFGITFMFVNSSMQLNSQMSLNLVDAVAFGTTFLLLSIIYMRMIRHSDGVLKDRNFQRRNVIQMSVSLALGTFLPLLIPLFSFIGYFLWFHVAVRIIPALANMATLPFRWIYLPRYIPEESNYDYSSYGNGDNLLHSESYHEAFDATFLNILGITLLLLGFIWLIKTVLKQKQIRLWLSSPLEEERLFLDNNEVKKQRFLHRNQIRVVYAKFLKLIRRNKILYPPEATSLDIQRSVRSVIRSEAISEIRIEYNRVRYGSCAYSKADVTRIKGLYKEIKKEFEKL